LRGEPRRLGIFALLTKSAQGLTLSRDTRIAGSLCHVSDIFGFGARTHPSVAFVSAEQSMRNESQHLRIKPADARLRAAIIAWRNRPIQRFGLIGRMRAAMVYSSGR
jgi:hypothetical protein